MAATRERVPIGTCEVCKSKCGPVVGIDCTCGHHFHIGRQLIVRSDECIECPRCETRFSPLDLRDPD